MEGRDEPSPTGDALTKEREDLNRKATVSIGETGDQLMAAVLCNICDIRLVELTDLCQLPLLHDLHKHKRDFMDLLWATIILKVALQSVEEDLDALDEQEWSEGVELRLERARLGVQRLEEELEEWAHLVLPRQTGIGGVANAHALLDMEELEKWRMEGVD